MPGYFELNRNDGISILEIKRSYSLGVSLSCLNYKMCVRVLTHYLTQWSCDLIILCQNFHGLLLFFFLLLFCFLISIILKCSRHFVHLPEEAQQVEHRDLT